MAAMFQRLFSTVEEEERPKAVSEAPEGTVAEASATVESGTDTGAESASAAVMEVVEASATAAVHPAESGDGLIDAHKLPPAADALAQLLADAPVAEAGAAEEAGISTGASQVPDDRSVAAAAPKKKGLLARLFRSKRAPKETVPEINAIDPIPTVEAASEPEAGIASEPIIAVAPRVEAEPEAAAATEVSSD